MKKIFKFNSKMDLSPRNYNFNELGKYSFRDSIRDLYDEFIRRPLYKIIYKNFFNYQNYRIDLVLPAKGFSQKARRKELNLLENIKGKKILNIGCGNAFDYHSWLEYEPKKIVGIDILNYSSAWSQILDHVKLKKYKTTLEFYRQDIIKFNYNEKFDFIVSDAVFEHCKDFPNVVNKCSKLLKKNGILYSSYGGPMWYTYGGDHFSGRDKIENGYNHLILNKVDYQKYFLKNVRSLDYELNEGGGGGVLVQEDLFSKLCSNQYIDIFLKNSFKIKKLYVEYCPIGFKLIKYNSKIKNKLNSLYKNIKSENFYLKTHIIYLKKS